MFDSKTLDLLLSDVNKREINDFHDIHALITENMDVDETAMLRRLYGISIGSINTIIHGSIAIVTVAGRLGDRHDTGIGVADLAGLSGVDLANAIKGAETAAKRRLTTSLTGYGFMAKRENQAGADLVPNAPVAPKPVALPAVNNERAAVETVTLTPAPAVEFSGQFAVAPAPEQVAAREALAASAGFKDIKPEILDAEVAKSHVPATEWPTQKPGTTKSFVEQPGGLFADEPKEAIPAQPVAQPSNPVPAPESAPTTPVATLSAPVAPAQPGDAAGAQAAALPDAVEREMAAAKPAGDIPATATEYAQFMARAAKIVRDVLPKAGIKDFEAGPLVLTWLLKQTGAKKQNKISKAKFEELLTLLEKAANPEAAVAILKA